MIARTLVQFTHGSASPRSAGRARSRARRPASRRSRSASSARSPAKSARDASSKPGRLPPTREHEPVGGFLARRARPAPAGPRGAPRPTSLRRVTDAPPGCAASHSQWRGSSVTSRATTPRRGRPGPAGRFSGAGRRAGRCRSARRSRRRRRGCAASRRRRAVRRTARATSARVPARKRSWPAKAVRWSMRSSFR